MFKGFFKPTKVKTFFTIVIAVIHIAIGAYGLLSTFCIETFDGYHINNCPEPTLLDISLQLIGLPLALVLGTDVFGLHINMYVSFFSRMLGLAILITFWYLLSCGIVKVKSKYFSR